MFDRDRLLKWRDLYKSALLDDVIPFWMRHGIDREYGGYLTYLDRHGALYGEDKPVWLVGRTIHTFATLFTDVEPRAEWLEIARHGYEFMLRHCFDAHGKMYFLVDRAGRPLRMRRYVGSEAFAVQGLTALARATGDAAVRQQAWDVFESMRRHAHTPGLLAPKTDPHTRPMRGLGGPMTDLHWSRWRPRAPGALHRMDAQAARRRGRWLAAARRRFQSSRWRN